MIENSLLEDLNNSRILITGGTGSFGRELTRTILDNTSGAKVAIYSRDEFKQFEMQQSATPEERRRLRFFLGDVRDYQRLEQAMENVDFVVHAAAIKQVPAAEYNPFECIKTNILGAENVVQAALSQGVRQVVALSTDKAAAPINLYGATKLCSDKLFVAANNMKGKRAITFSVVRYGNVMGSRGSVIPFFLDRRQTGVLPITDPEMTRFNILLSQGVELVLHARQFALGGEIFVPKIPSYRITDVAEAIGPECKQEIVGIRPGEKLHEEMVTKTDALNTIETPQHYIIVPAPPFHSIQENVERYAEAHRGILVPSNFNYSSDSNTHWLSLQDLRELIHEHLGVNLSEFQTHEAAIAGNGQATQ